MSDDTLPLVWWGRTGWPDGTPASATESPPFTAEQFGAVMQRLVVSPGPQGWLAPLADWSSFAAQRRPDSPVPLTVAAFEYSVPPAGFEGDAIAAYGSTLQTRRALVAAPLLHEQFQRSEVQLRSRVLTWWIDDRFALRQPGGPEFVCTHLDCGDGRGPRALPPSGQLTAAYGATQTSASLVLHGRLDGAAAEARCRIGIGQPVAPLPDLTLKLTGKLPTGGNGGGGNGGRGLTGSAWVFLAPGRRSVQHPLLMAEGFPGGYACDYLHDVMNQHGTLDALRVAGYDVVLLGFDQGAGRIQDNASVYVDAVQQLQALTPQPLVAAGMSMGGLVARYALAWMEQHGLPHRTRLFFTFDTPHQGAYTAVAAQFFARACAGVLGGAAQLEALLQTVANQQFVKLWLERDVGGAWTCAESPLRAQFLQDLAAVGGWPMQPFKLGLACGNGDGRRAMPPGVTLLDWQAPPWAAVSLATLGEDCDSTVGQADGLALVAEGRRPLPACRVSADTAWEGVPGSTNPYIGVAAALSQSVGIGELRVPLPLTGSIPTVSALDLDQAPNAPVPPPGQRRTPFDAVLFASQPLPHLGLEPALRDGLLQALGPPTCESA